MAIRKSKIYSPDSKEPYTLSRTRIENFLKCPRCFYVDRRLGVEPPRGPGFTLNIAVDELLKKEFDIYRDKQEKHPLQVKHNIDAIPYQNEKLDDWRNNFKGVEYLHPETNLKLMGAVDDLWVNAAGEVIVVDYKATSKKGKVSIEGGWGPSYKRQMEFYQWLLRCNGLTVSNVGYFVYCNGKKSNDRFDGVLEFDIEVIPYEGNDDWVEKTVVKVNRCLDSDDLPVIDDNCDYCNHYDDLIKVIVV